MTARKPRTTKKAPDDNALKAAILQAALAHAPFDGFTDTVLRRAAQEAGADKAAVARLFPDGALSLIEAFSEDADRKMETALAARKLSAMKIRARIKTAVLARIAPLRANKEAARRAAAFLTLPPHARAWREAALPHGRCHVAGGGRYLHRFQLLHQARNPGRSVVGHAAALVHR